MKMLSRYEKRARCHCFISGLVLSLVAFWGSGQVLAATYYVAKNGNNSNPGTSSQPRLTIKSGISLMSAGDTLIVKSGTYSEAFTNGIPGGTSWSNKTTIKANPGDTVVIKGPNSSSEAVFWFDQPSQKYIEIDGFVLDAQNVELYGIGIWGGSHHLRFSNVEIKNAPNQGVSILKDGGSPHHNEFINVKVHDTANGKTCFGNGSAEAGYCHGFYAGGDDTLIDGCELYNNNGFGIQFYPQGNNRNIIRNCLVHDNYATGIGSLGNNNQIYNNVIYNNGGGGMLITESGAEVYNNTVYNNSGGWGGITVMGSGHKVKNNIFYSTSSLSFGGAETANNLTSNPQFVNASSGDFHLKSSSAAIDGGTDLSSIFAYDLEGAVRPQGASFDVGAYEFGGAPPPDTAAPNPPSNLRVVSQN